MSRRVYVGLVIEMTDEMEREWAVGNSLPIPPRAKDTVDSVQSYVLSLAQGSGLGRFADIRIKGR